MSVCLWVCGSVFLTHRGHLPSLCTDHDQEQTPQGSVPPPPPPPPEDGWNLLEPGKIPQPNPDNVSVFSLYQTTTTDTYEHCAAVAAAAVAAGNTVAHYFSWWGAVDSPSRGGNVTVYRCWLSSQVGWEKGYAPAGKVHVVSGFRGVPRPTTPVAWGDGTCPGDCDCGAELPCGEYLFGVTALTPRTAATVLLLPPWIFTAVLAQTIGTQACGSFW